MAQALFIVHLLRQEKVPVFLPTTQDSTKHYY